MDHEGYPVNLVVPMSADEKRKLVKEIREDIKPLINQICNASIREGIQPLQRMIMQEKVETAELFARTNSQHEDEMKKMSEKFAANLEKASEDIY